MSKNTNTAIENVTNVNNVTTFGTGLAARFNAILNRESKAITTMNGDTEVSTLTLSLKHKLADGRESLVITNPETISAVERIQKVGDIETLTPTVKCVELAKMADSVESEFSMKVETFAYSVFGITKTTAQQYVRIGRYFYNEEGNMRSEKIPFLTTSQIIPLLARLTKKENSEELAENPLEWIESAFTPNESGKSLLHSTDSASVIKKQLKAYDGGFIDIHGESALTIEEAESRKAQQKADRAKKKESETSKTSEADSNKELTPIESFNMNLSRIFSDYESLAASFQACVDDKSLGIMRHTDLSPLFEKLESVLTDIVNVMEK